MLIIALFLICVSQNGKWPTQGEYKKQSNRWRLEEMDPLAVKHWENSQAV